MAKKGQKSGRKESDKKKPEKESEKEKLQFDSVKIGMGAGTAVINDC